MRAEWEREAYLAFVNYAKKREKFTTEDVRFANPDIVAKGDPRRWGHIAMAAKRSGIVDVGGYSPVRSSNGSAKRLWRSLIFKWKTVA